MEWVPAISRWVHVAAGIMWVGLLFYFNFVQGPALAAATADGSGAGIVRHVAPRALLWFRWAAVVTWLAGAALLGKDFVAAFALQPSHLAIGVGAWLGTIMLANVWLLVWPAQKKVLGLVPADAAARERARRAAFLVSRLNLALVVPMLFFMLAGAHSAVYFGR
ncbi:MAG: urate hydroxylase PuuD [Burkholderiales bacterium]|nr:urate hydroxylase PuuD [Burkholderiales bacterium]